MIRCPECKRQYLSELASCPNCGYSVLAKDGIPLWAPLLAYNSEGFKLEYFSILANLEDANFWFRARNNLIQYALKKYCRPFMSFMEVGCGTGYVLKGVSQSFPTVRLVGSEIYLEGLSFAVERVPRAKFIQMDARNMPYIDEFDVIGAFDVIEHVKEDELVLKGLYQAIKLGGYLMITVPQHQWLWSEQDVSACHQRRYSADDLHAKIIKEGFEIIRSTSFVSFLLPLMYLNRIKVIKSSDSNRNNELRMNPILNKALEFIMLLERGVLKVGFNLPVGGSRLVVARKNSQPI